MATRRIAYVSSINDPSHQQMFTVNIESASDIKLSDKKIESLVRNIISSEKDRDDSITSLTIKCLDTGDYTYSLNADLEENAIVTVLEKGESRLIVRVIRASGQALRVRTKTFEEIKSEFLQMAPVNVPVISFFWQILVYPLSLFTRMLQPSTKDLSLLEHQNLCRYEDSLQLALKWSVKALGVSSKADPLAAIGKEFTLKHQLQEATELGAQWASCNNKAERDAFTANRFTDLQTRIKKVHDWKGKGRGKDNHPVNLMLIPTGHWKDATTFQPVLLAFYLNTEGELCLSELTHGGSEESIAKDFVWKDFGASDNEASDKWKHSLGAILGMSTRPEPSASNFLDFLTSFAPDAFKGEIQQMGEIFSDSTRGPGAGHAHLEIENYRQKVWYFSDAEPMQRSEERRPHLKEDPWTLLYETIALNFPDAPLADKALFTLQVLNDRMMKVIDGLDEMPQEQKTRWVHQLSKELESLERKWSKMSGSDDSFSLLIAEKSPFASFRDNYVRLKDELIQIDAVSSKSRRERASLLNQVETSEYRLALPQDKAVAARAVTPSKSVKPLGTIQPEDYEQILRLKEAFTVENPADIDIDGTLVALDSIASRIDECVDAGAYPYAQMLYRQALLLLPTNVKSPFWQALSEKAVQDDHSGCFNRFSRYLGRINEYFWETKMKTFNFQLESEEWVELLSSEMALCYTMQLHAKWAESKVTPQEKKAILEAFGNIEQISYDKQEMAAILPKLSFEDCSVFVFGHKGVKSKASDPLQMQNDIYLRPSFNPFLAKKLEEINSYFSEMENRGGSLTLGSRLDEFANNNALWLSYMENNHPDVPISCDLHSSDEEKRQTALLYTARKNVEPPQFLIDHPYAPGIFSDLVRHQQMMKFLLRPYWNLELCSNGGAKEFWWDVKGVPWSERYPSYFEVLQDYRRIDFRGIYPYEFEIIPKGQGADFSAEIKYSLGFSKVRSSFSPELDKNEKLKKPVCPLPSQVGFNSSLYEYDEATLDPYYEAIQNDPVNQSYLENIVKGPSSNEKFDLKFVWNPVTTEGSWLSQELSRENTGGVNPLYLTTLDTIEIVKKNSNFYSEKNIEEVLDLALQNFEMFEKADEQRKFFSACFKSGLIAALLTKNPQYFVARVALWKAAIQKAVNEGNYHRAFFFLLLTTSIVQQAKSLSLPAGNQNRPHIDRIIAVMPTFATEFQLKDQPLVMVELLKQQMMDNSLDLETQTDYAAYLLATISQDAVFFDLKALRTSPDLLESGSMLGHLFLAAQRLLHHPGKVTIPQIGQSSFLWFHDAFLPWLLVEGNLPDPVLPRAIDEWITLSGYPPASGGEWQRDPTASNIWVKGQTRVDLAALEILTINGASPPPVTMSLPRVILESREFRHLFDDQRFLARMKPGKKSGEKIYQFTDDKGQRIRIRHEAINGHLSIEMKFRGIGNQKDSRAWHRFVLPEKSSDHHGFEKELEEYGIWVNCKDSSRGVALLPKDSGRESSPYVFQLEFDRHRKLNRVFDLSTQREVVHDETGNLIKTLGCLPEEKILFMKKPGSDVVTEIRLIGQRISLERKNARAPWIVQEGPYSGCHWVMGGGRHAQMARKFAEFGVNIEEIGMTFYDPDDKGLHFVFWPYRTETSRAHRKSPLERLDFVKEEEQKPLALTLDEQGKETGSATSHLYLAYLYGVKRDYENAWNHLEKALNSRITTAEDWRVLEDLSFYYRQLPGTSLRALTLKLKAELLIERLRSQQSESTRYNKQRSENFLERSRYVNELYNSYNESLKRSKERSPGAGGYLDTSDEVLRLSEDELSELSKISSESLEWIISKRNQLENLTKDDRALTSEVGEASEQTLKFLMMKRLEPPKNLEDLDEILANPRAELIEGHFFDLWNWIVKKKLTKENVLALYLPTSSRSAEIVRRLLIALAETPEKERKELNIPALQKNLPSSIFELVWKGIELLWAPEKAEESQREVEKALSTLNARVSAKKDTIFASERKKQEKSPPFQSKFIDPEKLKKDLEANPELFGSRLSSKLIQALKSPEFCSKLSLLKEENLVSNVITLIQAECDINALAAVREKELEARIEQLETSLRKPIPSLKVAARVDSQAFERELDNRVDKLIVDGYIEQASAGASVLSPEKIEQAVSHLKKVFPKEASDPMEAAENCLLHEGLVAIGEKLKQQASSQTKIIIPAQIDSFAKDIHTHFTAAHEVLKKLQGEILDQLQEEKGLPQKLQFALMNVEKVGSHEVFEQLLNAYQRMQLDNLELQQKIEAYLILAIEANLLSSRARELIEKLSDFKHTHAKEDLTANGEWHVLSSELLELVSAVTDRTRYCKGALEPLVYRKLLVSELRNNIIHRQEQIDLILEIVEDPSAWYELRMGLGKTSVIFPTVLLLLVERGMLPVGLLKNELLAEHAGELDRSTRLMLEEAGVRFSFDISDPADAATLAEKYYRLLHVKKDNGYIITTVHAKNSLEHKFALLQIEKRKLFVQLQENKKDQKGVQEALVRLKKEEHWLGKIKQLLNGNEDYYGFRTQLIGDEADEIWNVLYEDNLAVGKKAALDRTVLNVSDFILRKILSRWQNPLSDLDPLAQLGEAILSSEQIALRSSDITKKYIPELLRALLQDPEFKVLACGIQENKASINWEGAGDQQEMIQYLSQVLRGGKEENEASKMWDALNEDQEGLIAYLCSTGPRPKALLEKEACSKDQLKSCYEVLMTLKHFSQSTIESCLGQNPGIQIAVKKSDGFTVGPQTRGQEQKGMLFSNEYDIDFNHFMIYAAKLPDNEFIAKALKAYKEKFPEKYDEFVLAADRAEIPLLDCLNLKENWELRLDILKVQVFQNQLIRRSEEQYSLNVQESVYHLNVGGMMGVMNPLLLPQAKKEHKSMKAIESKQVYGSAESETLIRIECRGGALVSVADDSDLGMMRALVDVVADANNKAIFNSSASLGGRNNDEVVEELRKTDAGKTRTWVFVHSSEDSNQRNLRMWHPGDVEPKSISKLELKRLLQRSRSIQNSCCFYYGPADCRGTDLPIPSGKVTGIVSKTTKEEFYQMLWRARGLGIIHDVQFLTTKAVETRIREDRQLEANKPVDWQHLVQDVRSQNFVPNQQVHLMAAKMRFSATVRKGLRDALTLPRKEQDSPLYWKNEGAVLDDIVCDLVLEEATHPILYRNCLVNFDAEDSQATIKKTDAYIKETYKAEKEKLKTAKKKAITTLRALPYISAGPRIKTIEENFDETLAALKGEYQAFMNEWQTIQPYFAKDVRSQGKNEGTTLQQVQEQERQLEKTQEKSQETSIRGGPAEYHPFESWDVLAYLNMRGVPKLKGKLPSLHERLSIFLCK